jgi:hypothetical protein
MSLLSLVHGVHAQTFAQVLAPTLAAALSSSSRRAESSGDPDEYFAKRKQRWLEMA